MQVLKVCEVAEALQISPRMVLKLIAEGDLKSLRVGSLHRIRLVDLEEYVDSHVKSPKSAT